MDYDSHRNNKLRCTVRVVLLVPAGADLEHPNDLLLASYLPYTRLLFYEDSNDSC